MKITNVQLKKVENESNIKAVGTIVIDDSFAINGVRVVKGDERLFVAMPSNKGRDGKFRDIAHPINASTRVEIESMVLEAYAKL